jgi:hypothetical protein
MIFLTFLKFFLKFKEQIPYKKTVSNALTCGPLLKTWGHLFIIYDTMRANNPSLNSFLLENKKQVQRKEVIGSTF